MKKILLICNESVTVINFRREIIQFLKKEEWDVSVICGDSKYKDKIEQLGVTFYSRTYQNRSINPFQMLSTKNYFRKVINIVKPDVIFTFQLKPNIFGALAGKKSGIPILSMVEGLGDPFIQKKRFGKIIRYVVTKLYRKAFKYVSKVFFLNDDDKLEFLKRKIVREEQIIVIPGIGIDTKNYKFASTLAKEKRVVNLSRLLINKGIEDYCEIASLVHEKRPDIIFDLYGSEGQLTIADLSKYLSKNIINYKGYTENPAEVIINSRIVASTSYREGFPRVIMEAMALGRPTIAFDTVGTNRAVNDGSTGYLIKDRNLEQFANRIIELIDDEQKLIELGTNARNYCVENLDSNYVNKKIVAEIEKLLQ